MSLYEIIRTLYLELLSKIGDIKFFCNVLKAMYILKGPLFWQDQRKVSNNCKKIEFQLFSFLEINEFLFHTFVCHHILMKWFIFCRFCLCYCWNIAKNRKLLLFLWFQKIGPFKMYMALRTLQKNFMSPNFDNNSRLFVYSFIVIVKIEELRNWIELK